MCRTRFEPPTLRRLQRQPPHRRSCSPSGSCSLDGTSAVGFAREHDAMAAHSTPADNDVAVRLRQSRSVDIYELGTPFAPAQISVRAREQAQCQHALERLVQARFLCVKSNGMYGRLSGGFRVRAGVSRRTNAVSASIGRPFRPESRRRRNGACTSSPTTRRDIQCCWQSGSAGSSIRRARNASERHGAGR
jgi:hypothetical protein